MASDPEEQERTGGDRVPSHELAALLETSRALASSLELPVVLQTAIASACNVLDLETGAIYLLKGSTLKLGATTPPLPEDFPDEFTWTPLSDHPHIERCMGAGELISIEDVSAEDLTPAERAVCEARGLKSILYAPVRIHDEAGGAFIIGSTNGTHAFHEAELAMVKTLAHQVSLAVTNAHLYESLRAANDDLSRAYEDTLSGWAAALELRDREVHGHTSRVEDLTVTLARKMGIPDDQLLHVRRGTILHDIGKMIVPDSILHKPGPLTDEEWAVMRRHPQAARDMLARIEFLFPALDIPYCHHERWDGTGYPQGISGDAIPLTARVFAIVDVYDALTSDRPYRAAWSRDKALDHIRNESGKHFDPAVVGTFFEVVGQGH